MVITSCTNLIWANQEHTAFNCLITTDQTGSTSMPFCATPDDTEEYGRQLYQDGITGVYGPIAEYQPLSVEMQNIYISKQRHAAYIKESDPLFFKYQRGDGTQQEWLDKIAEIKARYPYVV